MCHKGGFSQGVWHMIARVIWFLARSTSVALSSSWKTIFNRQWRNTQTQIMIQDIRIDLTWQHRNATQPSINIAFKHAPDQSLPGILDRLCPGVSSTASMSTVYQNLPGTKASDMWNWNMRPFEDYKGPLALSEYIQEPGSHLKLALGLDMVWLVCFHPNWASGRGFLEDILEILTTSYSSQKWDLSGSHSVQPIRHRPNLRTSQSWSRPFGLAIWTLTSVCAGAQCTSSGPLRWVHGGDLPKDDGLQWLAVPLCCSSETARMRGHKLHHSHHWWLHCASNCPTGWDIWNSQGQAFSINVTTTLPHFCPCLFPSPGNLWAGWGQDTALCQIPAFCDALWVDVQIYAPSPSRFHCTQSLIQQHMQQREKMDCSCFQHLWVKLC